MNGRETYPQTILEGRTFLAALLSPEEIVIRSKRQWWFIALFILLPCPLMAAIMGLIVIAIVGATIIRPNLPELLCFTAFGVPLSFCCCLMVVVLLRIVLVRRVTLDTRKRTVSTRHIPGFGGEFDFNTVKAVTLLQSRDRSTAACHLCLTRQNKSGLDWIVTASGYQDSDYYQQELLPLAQLLAKTLDCPLESAWQRLSLFSIAKWPETSTQLPVESSSDQGKIT